MVITQFNLFGDITDFTHACINYLKKEKLEVTITSIIVRSPKACDSVPWEKL